MLKPSEVKNYEFKTAGRNAYKADDVDTFFAEVAISYEKMYRENSELIKRISLLADRLEQYKNDEVDIKQAVLSAQKAADIIIRDAQESVEDSKNEAEAILAAAKGEAAVIKADAEKQAIADSDLLMSLAKDKAEDIINKAKEKAHGILIAANNSASDKMGAANRTITSESLHYDMLKKEVSEFRASILAQYKTHIELISKLPELAIEEASKLEEPAEQEIQVEITEEELENPVFVEEDPQDSVLEFVDEHETAVEEDIYVEDDACIEEAEPVVKTTLPYDFFDGETNLEFIDDDNQEDDSPVIAQDGSIGFSRKNPLPVEDYSEPVADDFTDNAPEAFEHIPADSVNAPDYTQSSVEEPEVAEDYNSEVFSFELSSTESDDTQDISFSDYQEESTGSFFEEIDEAVEDEAPVESEILREHSSYSSFFDSIETIDIDDFEEEKPKHRGFFHRNK